MTDIAKAYSRQKARDHETRRRLYEMQRDALTREGALAILESEPAEPPRQLCPIEQRKWRAIREGIERVAGVRPLRNAEHEAARLHRLGGA